jgi:hypothetical protein
MNGENMRTCEAIYGPVQGRNIEALIVGATGQGCPCVRGLPCPLTDSEGRNPLAEVIPRSA